MEDELVTPITSVGLRKLKFDEIYDNEFQYRELVVRLVGKTTSIFIGRGILNRTYFKVDHIEDLQVLMKLLNYNEYK